MPLLLLLPMADAPPLPPSGRTLARASAAPGTRPNRAGMVPRGSCPARNSAMIPVDR